jgi:hypothetical protein
VRAKAEYGLLDLHIDHILAILRVRSPDNVQTTTTADFVIMSPINGPINEVATRRLGIELRGPVVLVCAPDGDVTREQWRRFFCKEEA